jgi:transposase
MKRNKELYLGKVVHKEDGVFYSKARGLFRYTVERGKESIESDADYRRCMDMLGLKTPKDSVCMDAYVILSALEAKGLAKIFSVTKKNDTLLALIIYEIMNGDVYRKAFDWFDDSVAHYCLPAAAVESQRISEFLAMFGEEQYFRRFFLSWIPYVSSLSKEFLAMERKRKEKELRRSIKAESEKSSVKASKTKKDAEKENCGVKISIDSTAIQSKIKIPITAFSYHPGSSGDQVRLIYVADRESGLPVFYHVVPGNTVDSTTLRVLVERLRIFGLKISDVVMDAGYCSEGNWEYLFDLGIPFVMRLSESNKKFYDELMSEHLSTLKSKENIVEYGNRFLYIKKAITKLNGRQIYAYICLDEATRSKEMPKFMKANAKNPNVSADEYKEKESKLGIFVIISVLNLLTIDLLPSYYSRQGIEQIFDLLKNALNFATSGTHTLETTYGGCLLAFMSVSAYIALDITIKNLDYRLTDFIAKLKKIRSNVYDSTILLIREYDNSIKDWFKSLGHELPFKLQLNKETGSVDWINRTN